MNLAKYLFFVIFDVSEQFDGLFFYQNKNKGVADTFYF